MFKFILLGSFLMLVNPVFSQENSANLAFEAGDWEQAKKLFHAKIKQDDKDILSYLFLAKIAVQQQDFDTAQESIEEIISLKSVLNSADVEVQAQIFHWLGVIMEQQAEQASIFSMSGYAKKSIMGYKKSAELAPANLEYRAALINFYLEAPGMLGGSNDEAIKQANIVVAQDELFGLKMLINCYVKSGNTSLLFSTFDRAINKYSNDAELLFMRGNYWKEERKYEKAIADYKMAVELPATNKEQKHSQLMALYWTGRISGFEEKYLDRGIAAYQQFLKLSDETYGRDRDWAALRMAKLMILNQQNDVAKKVLVELLASTTRQRIKDSANDLLSQLN